MDKSEQYQNGVNKAQNWINRRMNGESREDIENVDGFMEGGQFHPIRGSEDYNRVRGGDERAFSKKKKKK